MHESAAVFLLSPRGKAGCVRGKTANPARDALAVMHLEKALRGHRWSRPSKSWSVMPANITPAAKRFAQSGRRPGCGVAAVRAAGDADLICGSISPVAARWSMASTKIIELLAGHITVVELGELHPASRTGSIVRLEDGEPTCCGYLPRPMSTISRPAVGLARFGAAVDVEDQRIPLSRLLVQRMDQHALDAQPVTRFVFDPLLFGKAHLGQPRIRVGENFRFFLAVGDQRNFRGMLRRLLQDHRCSVARHAQPAKHLRRHRLPPQSCPNHPAALPQNCSRRPRRQCRRRCRWRSIRFLKHARRAQASSRGPRPIPPTSPTSAPPADRCGLLCR